MKNPIYKAISGFFGFMVVILFYILTIGITCLIVLWETGFIKDRYPHIYCLLTRERKNQFNMLSLDKIQVIHLSESCECDTLYYQIITPEDTTDAAKSNP